MSQEGKSGKMSDDDLLALLRQYELAAMGSSVAAGASITTSVYPSTNVLDTLEVDRFKTLNAYLARPLGNEIENRSQIVMPVLRDTVEWMMPQLMRMFAGSKYICRFDAENPNDEQQAEIETAYVTDVFMRQNNGFFVLHDFFKDALLLRNGYAEIETVEEDYVCEESLTGLDEIALASVLEDKADEKIEVLEQREYQQDVPLPLPQTPLQSVPMVQAPQLVLQKTVFDIRIRKSGKRRKVKVICLPPEEMRVSARAREGMEDLVYACHMTEVTRSDLISEGYDKAWVDSLQPGRPNWMEMDALARAQTVDELSIENPSDRSMQEIQLRRAVVRVDFDGDGIAELRRIVVGGDKIGQNEVIEETPFVSCEGMRMPHRHTGMSLYDLVMDLQVLQTELWRSAIDNLRLAQNTRVAVDWRNCNFDDLTDSRLGGAIRGNGPPSQWIMPIETPTNLTEQVMPALAYTDQLRSNRTGIGKGTMGLDADELQNVTKGGQLASMSAASLILEHIARHLGEGVKGIMQKTRSEIIRNQDKPAQFQLSGKWVTVDPKSWRASRGISVAVGLGSGNSEERRANSMLLGQMMQGIAQFGMVGPKQAWEAFRYGLEGMGINAPERFAMEPDSDEYKQHMQQMQAQQAQAAKSNPAIAVAQIKATSDGQIAQSRAQTEAIKQQGEQQRQILQLQTQVAEDKLQMVHEAMQGMGDRGLELFLGLAKIIAPIIASQKLGPDQDAGAVLAADTHSAERGLQ